MPAWIEKMIGCIPDTIGVVTQFQSLANFAGGCYARMPEHGTDVSIMVYRILAAALSS